MTDDFIVHSRIMRRVRRVYYLRKIFHPAAVKAYAGGALLLGVLSLVSVMDVIANIPAGTGAPLYYVMNAFLHTEIVVKVAVVAFAVIAGLLIRDIAHMAKSPHFARA